MMELTLSDDEIFKLTGYRRPAFQLKALKALGIPAVRRVDNAVVVLRMHCIHPTSIQQQQNAPRLKSSRK